MSEVDEAVRGMSGTLTSTLQITMSLVEQRARQRADRMRRAAAESEQAQERARKIVHAENDAAAARWAAAAHAGPDWIEGYGSAVEWREFDPRAAAAADEIEAALRRNGTDLPDTSAVREANAETLEAAMTPSPGEEQGRLADRTDEAHRLDTDAILDQALPAEVVDHIRQNTRGHEQLDQYLSETHDPQQRLEAAYTGRGLEGATSPGAVLLWRMQHDRTTPAAGGEHAAEGGSRERIGVRHEVVPEVELGHESHPQTAEAIVRGRHGASTRRPRPRTQGPRKDRGRGR